jgi:hypothetical protein
VEDQGRLHPPVGQEDITGQLGQTAAVLRHCSPTPP